MRNLKITLIFVLLLTSCFGGKNKDVSDIDYLIKDTDSLLEFFQNYHELANENFFSLIDDSLYIDSLSVIFNPPDSMGLYQYLKYNRKEFEELFTQTKQEIFFAKDQLESLKSDFLENNISEPEYLSELSDLEEMIRFLKERVDSNTYIISELSIFSADPLKDSLP